MGSFSHLPVNNEEVGKIKQVVVNPSKLKAIENGIWPKLKGYDAQVLTEIKHEEPSNRAI